MSKGDNKTKTVAFEASGVAKLDGVDWDVGYRFNHPSGGGFVRCLRIYGHSRAVYGDDKFEVESASPDETQIKQGTTITLTLRFGLVKKSTFDFCSTKTITFTVKSIQHL